VVIRGTDSARRGGTRGGRGRYVAKKKVCRFCVDKVTEINYKDSAKLSRYITDRGKIEPRRRTGTCARHQRALTEAIKKARHIALIPFVPQHVYATGGVRPLGSMPRRPIRDYKEGVKSELKQSQTKAVAPKVEKAPEKTGIVEVKAEEKIKTEESEVSTEKKVTKRKPISEKKEEKTEEKKES